MSPELWERQPGESARAFDAFCRYRDLGPERSLNAAYDAAGSSRAPGYWADWSSAHDWVRRAAAYDEYLDAQRRRVREEQMRRLEARRLAFELENQDRAERRCRRIEANLDKADSAPIVEVTTEKEDGTRVKVKGINLAGYARLVDAANKTAETAILGVRPPEKTDTASPVNVRGEFAWEPPPPPASGEP